MKCTSEGFRSRDEEKQRSIKIMLAIKRLMHSKTDQNQIIKQKTQDTELSLPLVDVHRHHQPIFAKNKRKEYSGYKNAAKKNQPSKIYLDYAQKRKSVSNQYKINFQNIQKLRKRYSLQPTSHRNRTENTEGPFPAQSNFMQKKQSIIFQESHDEKISEFKEKLRKANNKKYAESSKTIIYRQQIVELCERKEQKLPFFKKSKSHQKHPSSILIAVQMELHKKSLCKSKEQSQRSLSTFKKRFAIKDKRKSEMQIRNERKKVVFQLKKKEKKGEDISGWSSQSFYSKTKINSEMEEQNKT